MGINIGSFLGGNVLASVSKIIDSINAPAEAKTAAQTQLNQLAAEAQSQATAYDQALTTAQQAVVAAEANSDSWITKSWRPLASLSFVILLYFILFGGWLHLPQPDWASVPADLWSTIKLCLGGYMGLRTTEKLAPHITNIVKAANSNNGN